MKLKAGSLTSSVDKTSEIDKEKKIQNPQNQEIKQNVTPDLREIKRILRIL